MCEYFACKSNHFQAQFFLAGIVFSRFNLLFNGRTSHLLFRGQPTKKDASEMKKELKMFFSIYAFRHLLEP
jgi:hypothetical protein